MGKTLCLVFWMEVDTVTTTTEKERLSHLHESETFPRIVLLLLSHFSRVQLCATP